MREMAQKRVLVAGPARSGTSWVGKVLGATEDASYIHEPDNCGYRPFAVRALLSVGLLPMVADGDRASAYEELWTAAFTPRPPSFLRRAVYSARLRTAARLMHGLPHKEARAQVLARKLGPRLSLASFLSVPLSPGPAARTVVAKTVESILSLEWIVERTRPGVLIVLRHPFNVVASRKGMGWIGRDARGGNAGKRVELAAALGIEPLDDEATPLQRAAWQVGTLICALEDRAEAHPDWLVVTHESLCEDPVDRFREVASNLGLTWSPRAESFVRETNRPGQGYEINRVAEEEKEKWRKRLTPSEIEEITAVLERFPMRTYRIGDRRAPIRRGAE